MFRLLWLLAVLFVSSPSQAEVQWLPLDLGEDQQEFYQELQPLLRDSAEWLDVPGDPTVYVHVSDRNLEDLNYGSFTLAQMVPLGENYLFTFYPEFLEMHNSGKRSVIIHELAHLMLYEMGFPFMARGDVSQKLCSRGIHEAWAYSMELRARHFTGINSDRQVQARSQRDRYHFMARKACDYPTVPDRWKLKARSPMLLP